MKKIEFMIKILMAFFIIFLNVFAILAFTLFLTFILLIIRFQFLPFIIAQFSKVIQLLVPDK